MLQYVSIPCVHFVQSISLSIIHGAPMSVQTVHTDNDVAVAFVVGTMVGCLDVIMVGFIVAKEKAVN